MRDPLESYLVPVREKLLHNLLRVFAVVGGIACGIASLDQLLLGNYILVAYYLLLYASFLILVLNSNLSFAVKRSLPIIALSTLLTVEYIFFGSTSFSYIIIYSLVVFTGLMFGIRYAMLCLSVAFCIVAYRYWGQYISTNGSPVSAAEYLQAMISWMSPTVGQAALISLTVLAISIMLRQLQATLAEKNELLLSLQREKGIKERALDALKLSEEQFNRLFEHAKDAVVFLTRKDGKIVLANDAAKKLTGLSGNALQNKPVFELLPATDHTRVRQIIDGESVIPTHELKIKGKDNSSQIIEVSATEVEGGLVFLTFRDITEKKQLEGQLAQSHKLEAIGQLAGGIAHDFNNSLQVIIGFCELARFKVNGNAGSAELEKIYESGKRAQNLIAQLLAFSRQQQLESRPLDLNTAVEESMRLVNRLIGEHIELRFAAADNPLIISGDRTQIEQVVLNLCINARDAIGENGELEVEISEALLSEAFCRRSAWALPGHFAKLTIRDNGSGMDRETREKVFEPFFTTKEAGKGTGLGLSSVLGIVQQHGGLINLESEPGKGTSVSVYFPLAEELANS
jgi:PAS domain S-box-containing protein